MGKNQISGETASFLVRLDLSTHIGELPDDAEVEATIFRELQHFGPFRAVVVEVVHRTGDIDELSDVIRRGTRSLKWKPEKV